MFLHRWLSREPILQRILQREMPGEKFSRLAFAFLSCSAIPTSLSTGTGGGNPHPYPERKFKVQRLQAKRNLSGNPTSQALEPKRDKFGFARIGIGRQSAHCTDKRNGLKFDHR
jgi:hypothetical protein